LKKCKSNGPEIVKFTEDFDQMIYVKNFHVKKTGQLIIGQAHGDHVVKLPEGETLNARFVKYAGNDFEGKSYLEVYEEIRRPFFSKCNPYQADVLEICFNFIKKRN